MRVQTIRILLTVFLFAGIVHSTFAQQWHTHLDSALLEAQEKQTVILVNFSGSDWCRACMVLEKTFFSDSAFLSYSDSIVLLNVDFPRKAKNKPSAEEIAYRESLAEKWNPHGQFPSLLLLNSDGVLVTVLNLPNGNTDDWLTSFKHLIEEQDL